MARKPPPLIERPKPTSQAERLYYSNLLKYLDVYKQVFTQEVVSAIPGLLRDARAALPETLRTDSVERFDAVDEKLAKLFARVQKRLAKIVPKSKLKKMAEAAVNHTNDLSKRNLAKQIEASHGAQIEPLLTDKGLSAYFKEKVATNVGLIKSIPEEDHPKLQKKLSHLISQDATVSDIGKVIQEHFGVTKRKAAFIARDQVNKLNGELDQHRQRQMGGRRYRWRTMDDLRVTGKPGGLYPDARPSHWAREGKIFSWDKPPAGGHPKERVGCRCYAEPVLEDLLDE